MKHHPLCAFFPLMEGKCFDDLKVSIMTNGQLINVLTYQDMILDGRNRERACEALGLPVRYEQSNAKTDAEAVALLISLNLSRRHLSENQRTVIALEYAKLFKDDDTLIMKMVSRENSRDAIIHRAEVGHLTLVDVLAADKLNVKCSRVKHMRIVEAIGGESAVAEIISGKTSLDKKYRELATPRALAVPKAPKRSGPGRPRKDEQRVSSGGVDVTSKHHPVAISRYLSREEVDPEFVGTALDFAAKYGHVQTMTAEQYMTVRLTDWAQFTRSLARHARGMPALPKVDHNWLRSPKESDVVELTKALEFLRPLMAEAEALLARAVAVSKK